MYIKGHWKCEAVSMGKVIVMGPLFLAFTLKVTALKKPSLVLASWQSLLFF